MQDKILKSKKIQEEQKRQMDWKHESDKKKVHDEIEMFKTSGMTASAPFYVAEDKRIAKEKALRGSGVKVA